MDTLRTFEVNGRTLKIAFNAPETTAAPSAVEPAVNAPGAGAFTIGSLSLSAEKIAPGESLTLSAQIRGENIAFIYTEILFQDPDLDQYYGPITQEYVLAEKNEEVQGVKCPVWEPDINLELQITPTLRVLTDGVDSAFAFMHPLSYGQEGYQLDGLFSREGDNSPRRARLELNSAGEITRVLAFKEKGRRSAPHALTFKAGDQFTPFVQILTGPGAEKPAWQSARGTSTTLTRRETAFRWVNESPAAGNYLLGLVIQDLDGEETRQYASFTLSC
jgi:hypothetical protein